MVIIQKGAARNGVPLQVENWGKSGFMVAAYPVAARASDFIHINTTFRLGIKAFSKDDALQVFKDLESGNKQLSDFAERFWNGERDKFILGI